MKVFFVAVLFLIPLYAWYKFIMKVDRVFFDGRTKDLFLYLVIGLGWILLLMGMVTMLGI
ncbi:MAG: hypothetical protein CBC01_00780 [Betaproteobacteria bacterium TMED41]|nr:MAG: hypothetical protein CBC01_00780 [Betaproteobacteria bacterium TMED41]|tara:strand:+ start:471 stop:650 length:180 start_codon:yes stop_codon:yes gene_type:complete